MVIYFLKFNKGIPFVVSPQDAIRTGLGEEGPDSGYVVDIEKFQCMKQWLDQERVLLLRSPPGSGKTSFAVHFADHLINAGYSVKYMSAALGENQPDDETSMDDIWENTIGYTFSQFCKSRKKPFYVIVDEAQIWYPMNVAMKAGKELETFWGEVKTLLKPGRDFSSYIDARSGGASTSAAASMSTVPVRLLCLAGYGEASLGTAATPLTFVDPLDPVTNLPSPLGLDFLRFNREKTHKLISKYTKIKALEGKMTSFSTDPAVRDLIFQETNGHVGAIRTFLFHIIRAGKKTKDDIIEFISSPKSRIELTVYRPFLSVSAETIQGLTPKDIALLLRCIASYKRGNHSIPVNILTADVLIKLGIFVRAGLATLAFPSPLHFDVTLHNVRHRQVELEQTRPSFEAAIQEMVLRMDPKLLQGTPVGHQPFERQWEDECYNSFRAMSDEKVAKQVGHEYNQQAYLDIYVERLEWGIELIRLGGGKKLDEHVRRFSKHDGRYRNIPMREYAVLNFTNKAPTQATLNLDPDVWYLVYNDRYTNITIYRKDRTKEDWDMIGYQGHTES